jgi:GTP-binding protein EngB required for normal cell division
VLRRWKSDSSKLLISISELETQHGIQLKKFPNLVVIGPQSSGKSSVIEALCGESILPKAMKMATMKPTHLTTIYSPNRKFKIGDKEYIDPAQASSEIDRLNNNGHVQKINVTIWSPNVHNAKLVDLPGLFVVASKDNSDLPKKVKEMSCRFLEDPNIIPVVVHSGPSDPATNQAIKLVNKYNRDNDALGIITKVDMLEKQKTEFISEMLRGESCPMGHGYCAVILRNDKDTDAGKTIDDKILEEKAYFAKFPNLKPAGVPNMRQIISEIQLNRIQSQIPTLLADIDQQIKSLETSKSFISSLMSDNQKQMITKLRIMIEKLVSSSLDRSDFEEKLKSSFKKEIGKYMTSTSDDHTKFKLSRTEYIDDYISAFNSSNKSTPESYRIDGVKELFSYGLVSTVFIDNHILKDNVSNEIKLCTTVPMISVHIDDPLGKKRLNWNRYLNAYFSRLLADDNIHKIVHDVTHNLLMEYIYRDLDESAQDVNSELTRKFAEYMVGVIGNEAYESNIKYAVTALINLERRPQVSLSELTRYIAQMYPEYFTFNGAFFESFSREKKKLELEVYGDIWNEAYLHVVGDKLSENCYRNVAVNLLDRMVEKLLEMTMDLFNKENAMREQTKINEKLIKLNEIKTILLEGGGNSPSNTP